MERIRNMVRWVSVMSLAGVLMALSGCMSYGPAPQTVAQVEVPKYMGLWHEIASNPQFFNEDLVSVTAEYTLRDDGKVTVLNKGRQGSPDGPEESIEGVARVVDKETNAKLGVRFPSVPFSFLFEGEYWIVVLDEDYEYAVVTDSRQSTLFILNRSPAMTRDRYDAILAELAGLNVDTSRLRVTGTITE
jgi:apolipoprotein D and lipocalin family protein